MSELLPASWLPWGILLPPALGALVVGLTGRRWGERAVGWLATGAVGVAFAVALAGFAALAGRGVPALQAPGLPIPLPGGGSVAAGLILDPLSLAFALTVTGIGFLVHVYSIGYMAGEPGFRRYFVELNYFTCAMLILVLSDNFLGLLVGWANVTLASFLLIGFWYERPEARPAATKAFVINIAGETAMLAAASVLTIHTGELGYQEVFARLGELGPGTVTAVAALLLVGAVAKSAQVPLHTWLPDAMAGPTPVSALIHAATMVTAGVYLLLRAHPLFAAAPGVAGTAMALGAVSALLGSLIATAQTDIKRILAYSTLSQIGYMFLAAAAGAYTAATFHFFTHAFFKAGLFLVAGVLIHLASGEQDIRRLSGLVAGRPLLRASLLAGLLALAGLPPFSGFFSKEAILSELLASGHPWVWATGVAAAFFTAYYAARLYLVVVAGRAEVGRHATGTGAPVHGPHTGGHRVAGVMTAPVVLLAVGSLVAGWIDLPGRTAFPEAFLAPVFAEREGGGTEEALRPGEAAPGPGEAAPTVAARPATAGGSVPTEPAGSEPGAALTLGLPLAATLLGAAWGAAAFRPGGAGRKKLFEGHGSGLGWLLEQGLRFDEGYRSFVVMPTIRLGERLAAMDRPGIAGVHVGALAFLAGVLVLALCFVWLH